MILKLKYFSILLLLSVLASCFLKKKDKYTQADSYQEISDINSHQSPNTIAKEMGATSKEQKRAYLKQLKKTKRQMDRRNRKKQKNIIIRTKTRKVRSTKSDTKKSDVAPRELTK